MTSDPKEALELIDEWISDSMPTQVARDLAVYCRTLIAEWERLTAELTHVMHPETGSYWMEVQERKTAEAKAEGLEREVERQQQLVTSSEQQRYAVCAELLAGKEAAEAKLSALVEAVGWMAQDHDIKVNTHAQAVYWAEQFKLACARVRRALLHPAVKNNT